MIYRGKSFALTPSVADLFLVAFCINKLLFFHFKLYSLKYYSYTNKYDNLSVKRHHNI